MSCELTLYQMFTECVRAWGRGRWPFPMPIASPQPSLWQSDEESGFVGTVSSGWLGSTHCTTRCFTLPTHSDERSCVARQAVLQGTAAASGFITLVFFPSPVLLHYGTTWAKKLEKFTILLFPRIHFMSTQGGKFSPFPFLLLFPWLSQWFVGINYFLSYLLKKSFLTWQSSCQAHLSRRDHTRHLLLPNRSKRWKEGVRNLVC